MLRRPPRPQGVYVANLVGPATPKAARSSATLQPAKARDHRSVGVSELLVLPLSTNETRAGLRQCSVGEE